MRGACLGSLAIAVALAVSASPLAERASEAGLDFIHFNGMSGELYFAENMGSGAALVDYDGDGDLDAYLVQGSMLGRDKRLADATFPPPGLVPPTDRLFRNDLAILPDGSRRIRFVDVTESSGIRAPGYGMGVAAGDIDNDGDPDLYVTNFGPNQMLRNNGDGSFRDVTAETGTGDRSWGVSAAFLDYDRDGWLDLFVGNYVDFRIATHKPCASETGQFNYCGPLAYNPERDVLYRNRGDGTFEDATLRAAIGGEFGAALGVSTADLTGDGWPDIYVANDQTANQMWVNQRDGTFRNEALLSGTAVNEEGQPEASMGLVAGDVDGDGAVDLFMTHLDRQTNTLYLNDGSGMFDDRTRGSGLGTPSFMFTGFGVALFDYDLDGWLDLFVANGAVQQLEALVRSGDPYPLHQPNQLFRNLGAGRFEEVKPESLPFLALSEVSRGVASGDLDRDGDPDLLLINSSGPARLLLDEVESGASWAALGPLPGVVDSRLLGAGITVTTGSRTLRRRMAGDGSYASANDVWVLAGLGEERGPLTVRAQWPAGSASELRDLPAGRRIALAPTPGGAR